MQNNLVAVIHTIEEQYRNSLSAASRNYLEVDLGKEGGRLGYADIHENFRGINVIVPIKEAVDGMKVMIDGRTFVKYVQFESGVAMPEYVAGQAGLSGKPYIANEDMVLNFV